MKANDCVCGHRDGWHRARLGSCLECQCVEFVGVFARYRADATVDGIPPTIRETAAHFGVSIDVVREAIRGSQ